MEPMTEYARAETERLTEEKQRLQKRIGEIDTVLAALAEVPQIEKVIDLIFKHAR